MDPLLTDPPEVVSLTMRVVDDNTAGDTSVLQVDVDFDIEVLEINQAPVLDSNLCADIEVKQGESASCLISFSDPNSADSLTYSIETPQTWLSNTAGTLNINTLTSTPFNTYSVTFRATDDNSAAHPSVLYIDETFDIIVVETNFAPTLNTETCDTLSIQQGESASCSVSVDDLNVGDSHSFAFLSGPSWAGNVDGAVTLAPELSTATGV